jgi:TATA-box binding protein (TBP) (component of TFIID and TFIIIB)
MSNALIGHDNCNELKDLDAEWESFLNDDFKKSEEDSDVKSVDGKKKIDPKKTCSDLYISTKTKITYLNEPIDLNIFWDIPIIPYNNQEEGIIKKQMKFTCDTKEEYDKLQEKQKDINCLKVNVIKNVDNPGGHTKFKYVCKLNVGISKKDILSYKTKKKGAFYNCMVIIMRIFYKNEYKEVNVKLFNTGKLSFPGMLGDDLMEKTLENLVSIFKGIGKSIEYKKNKIETVLINSNFNCGFFINRDNLYNILKFEYGFNVNYDPCSYPGIQCKYKQDNSELSFMIFRTGSVLIVGKCEEDTLYSVYDRIKNILIQEYDNIYSKQQNTTNIKKTKKKKAKRKIVYFHDK